MESVPVLDLYRINTGERDAVQEQAHSFSMVFFVLTDFQDTLQQDYRMARQLFLGDLCSDTYTHCTKVAQGTAGVVWLCSGSLWPQSLWREVPGYSVVTPTGAICCLGLFPIKQLAFEGCMLPLVCVAPPMADYSKLKLMCEKFCNKSAVCRQQSALLTS